MKRFRVIISIVLLTASLFIIFNQLFTPQPIQIILETGQEVTTQNADYFSLADALLLIIASFVIGSTSVYLFYNAETKTVLNEIKTEQKVTPEPELKSKYDMILPLLRPEEKKILLELINTKGEILQNELVLKSGLTKVKITRILSGLEKKRLISKERYGLTNKIKLVNNKETQYVPTQ